MGLEVIESNGNNFEIHVRVLGKGTKRHDGEASLEGKQLSPVMRSALREDPNAAPPLEHVVDGIINLGLVNLGHQLELRGFRQWGAQTGLLHNHLSIRHHLDHQEGLLGHRDGEVVLQLLGKEGACPYNLGPLPGDLPSALHTKPHGAKRGSFVSQHLVKTEDREGGTGSQVSPGPVVWKQEWSSSPSPWCPQTSSSY